MPAGVHSQSVKPMATAHISAAIANSLRVIGRW
jgi:hypothetical protein